MPMRILLFPVVKNVGWSILGIGSLTGLFAVDDIPGWTEISNVAKVSIIGVLIAAIILSFFFIIWSLVALVKSLQKDHKEEIDNGRSALLAEIKDSRESFGKVITTVTASNEKREEHSNIVLNDLNDTIRVLSTGVAGIQAVIQDCHSEKTSVQHQQEVGIAHEDALIREKSDQARHTDFGIRHADDVQASVDANKS